MRLEEKLFATVPDGNIINVCIGLHWTAVVADVDGRISCGLASTLSLPHEHGRGANVPQAGELEKLSGHDLVRLMLEDETPTLSSIGVAATNALLPGPSAGEHFEMNAEHVIAQHGAGKRVAIVGRFPFIPRIQQEVGELFVLELDPHGDDLPAESAPDIIPTCDVVALTGMALVNHTLEDLLALCEPSSLVLVLGPSTPLSPVFFDYGVHYLSGSLVADIEAVLRAVRHGANFRQVHHAGVRLITMGAPGAPVLT
jgi:uncharacterized protein (DUF4213/DUF364 family)